MTEYIYLIHPLRHEFFENPTLQEEAAMDEHYEYLKKATLEVGTVHPGWALPGRYLWCGGADC